MIRSAYLNACVRTAVRFSLKNQSPTPRLELGAGTAAAPFLAASAISFPNTGGPGVSTRTLIFLGRERQAPRRKNRPRPVGCLSVRCRGSETTAPLYTAFPGAQERPANPRNPSRQARRDDSACSHM